MRANPLLWPGVAVVLGAWTFPHWEPGALSCLAGVLLCAALGQRSALGLVVAAFWLGNLAPASRAAGPVLRGPVAVSGTVVLASGSQGIVETDEGRVLLSADRPLQRGTVHAFGVGRRSWSSALPGEPDPELFARTARVHSRVSATAIEHPERPLTLSLARHAGLLHALTTGDRSYVDEGTTELLKRTGTAHVLAVSGLHVGLLAGLAALLLRAPLRMLVPWGVDEPRWLLPIAGSLLVVGFGAAVGWPVSTRRAAVMVAGALLATAMARPVRAWNLLGAAAMVAVLTEPACVRTLSFQLSFGAVAGMLSLRWPRAQGPARWLTGSLGATLGATLGTLPAMAWTLQELPVAGPVANLVAVPSVGLMLPCALLASATGWLFPLALADTTAEGLLWALGHLDGPVLHPAVGPIGALALLGAVLWSPGRPSLLLLGLFLRPMPVDRVTFLSVGQGDAALIEGPERALIDGGPPGDRVLRYLRRRGIRRLDRVVVSHMHPDHHGGLEPVLRELSVGVLELPRLPAPGEDRTLLTLAMQQGATIVTTGALHPSMAFLAEHGLDLNESSRVHLEQAGGRSILFTGDIEQAGEAARRWPRADVLKVPHHGSTTSSSPGLLFDVQPQLAIIGCGHENRFRHPRPEVLWRYRNVDVLRTDVDGTIALDADGVRTWKPGEGWQPVDF
jgi:competence protein ComEC